MKTRPVVQRGQRGTHTVGRIDRQAETKKLIDAFRNFANAPKNAAFFTQHLKALYFSYFCRIILAIPLKNVKGILTVHVPKNNP